MTGTGNGLAVRNGSAPAQQQPGAALALIPGQTMWTQNQHAALVAMGIPAKATSAELGVFLHQCQRLRLDPFTKQIYLIYRKVKDGDRWIEKPTTQIGIDGFRVTRDRIAAERGVSVEYEDTIWYDSQGQAYAVWLWDEPPAACRFVVLVDGRRFPAVLRFNEYCQFGREDDNGNRPRTGRWRDGHAHQIEKCAEADALRRAFPNDLSGVILEDAAPLDDPGAPDRMPSDRPRVTAEQARARTTVTATVVTPDVPPAGEQPSPPPPAAEPASTPAGPAGGTKTAADYIGDRLDALGVEDRVQTAARIVGRLLPSLDDLSPAEANTVMRSLRDCKTPEDLDGMLAELAMANDPRDGTDA
jgi:phage recombination protein Bet